MDVESIIKARQSEIKAWMAVEGVDSLLLTSPENVTYATLFSGDDSWVLVGRKKIWLLTDSRYTEQAAGECVSCEIIERKGAICDALAKIIAKNKTIKSIGVERGISLLNFNTLESKLSVGVKAVSNIAGNLRQCKDAFEISCIKKAAMIAKSVLAAAMEQLSALMTESELAGIIEFEMRKNFVTAAFDTIIAFGANASRPHHRPSSKKLKTNDTILIDYGVKYKGYCCDITRCFGVGRVSDAYRKAYTAVLEAQAAAIEAVKPGDPISQADMAARKVIKTAGLPDYGHGTGHGFGLNIHEAPTVYRANDEKFQPGQVVTIEPGVYIPGKLGIRIEDDVLVTETGCKVLTRSENSPNLVVIAVSRKL